VIEDSTDIFGISGGRGFEHPKPPLGTPLSVLLPFLPAAMFEVSKLTGFEIACVR